MQIVKRSQKCGRNQRLKEQPFLVWQHGLGLDSLSVNQGLLNGVSYQGGGEF